MAVITFKVFHFFLSKEFKCSFGVRRAFVAERQNVVRLSLIRRVGNFISDNTHVNATKNELDIFDHKSLQKGTVSRVPCN